MASEARTSMIEVVFGAPVELSQDHQRRLVSLIGEICDGYEDANEDRVMWPAGIGDRPTGIWSNEPSFDSSVFQIDCCERERFEGEKRPRSPDPRLSAPVEVGLSLACHSGAEVSEAEVEAVAHLLQAQMQDDEAQNLPSSLCRERGLVWLEGWFDLAAALPPVIAESAGGGEAKEEARRAFIAGFAQALYNLTMTPNDFFEAWWDFGQFYDLDFDADKIAPATLATPSPIAEAVEALDRITLRRVISEARASLRLVQGCLECNAADERRWRETIEWLEKLA